MTMPLPRLLNVIYFVAGEHATVEQRAELDRALGVAGWPGPGGRLRPAPPPIPPGPGGLRPPPWWRGEQAAAASILAYTGSG
jgi:hypothetical protein